MNKTLQDALFEQSGAAEVAHIDFAGMAAMAAPPSQQVDRRTAASVSAELRNVEGNYIASEEDRKAAERDVNNLTGAHAKITAAIAELRKHPNTPRAHKMMREMEPKLLEVNRALNDPRTGAKTVLETKTKIAESRKRLLAKFRAARPFEGAPTNQELLDEDRELTKLLDAANAVDATVSQPVVGVSSLRAE